MSTDATPKPKPVSMDTVNDGVLHGKLTSTKTDCQFCGVGTRCLEVFEVVMPAGIELKSTIIQAPEADEHIVFLGVGCGDYAKFHRQVAHIMDKQQARVEKKKDKKLKKSKKHGR